MKVYKAPEDICLDRPSVFLAGSIEMGKAVDWQSKVTESLKDEDVIVLNPRRDDWDSSWEQKYENPQFREQVEWELNAMDQADVIAMHFEPDTMSPITLLEFGLHICDHKLIVHCPEGFWRKGNVDTTINWFNKTWKTQIYIVNSIDELIEETKIRLNKVLRV